MRRAARVIGFGGSAHDWSVCLLDGGRVVAALAEERAARRKYGIGADLLRSRARTVCLEATGWAAEDVEAAVACDLVPLPLAAPFRRSLVRIRHHRAHALAAYHGSGFVDDCAMLVADNGGSILEGSMAGAHRVVETVTGWGVCGGRLELVYEVTGTHALEAAVLRDYYAPGRTDNSLGDLYRLASETIGFLSGSGAAAISEDGKTMGLSAYGDERHVDALGDFIRLGPDGDIRIRLTDGALAACLRAWVADGPEDSLFARRAAVARATQVWLERALLHAAGHLRRLTGARRLALAGGVALNCLANSRIASELGFDSVFAFPAAGDDGIAIGAACYGHTEILGRRDPIVLDLPFLGPAPTPATTPLDAGLRPAGTLVEAARALADRRTVGVIQGRSEFGPRALGNRSILASPVDRAMHERLNRVTKRRETFRPFAPAVRTEWAGEIFDFPAAAGPMLPFMLATARVRPAWRDRLPAVTHIDDSARVQVVDAAHHPRLHRLLSLFEQATGVPVLLNTSFNRAGEALVETVDDAIECFLGTDLDYLLVEDNLFARPTPEGSNS